MAAALALLVLLGLAARDVVLAANGLRAAQAGLSLDLGDRGSDRGDGLSEDLLAASAALDAADARLARPAPRIVASLPLVGRSWRAEQHAVDAGQAVVAAATTVVSATADLRGQDGLDAQALRVLAEELDQQVPSAQRALQRLRDSRTWGTPPQVGRGVDQALAVLSPALEALSTGAAGAELASGLLGADRPRTWLLALQNNAELRGAGGFASTFTTVTADRGRLQLAPFRDVIDVTDPLDQARRVPSSPPFHEDFGPYLADTTHWRMWTMSPHVPDVGEVGAGIAERLLGQRPDLVMLLDVPAVVALAGLSGQPVELPDGEQVPPDQLVDLLLVESYADAGTDGAQQVARRAELRAAAGSAATQVLRTDVEPWSALSVLSGLARGRHLAVWSDDPAEQEAIVDLGIGGALSADLGDLLHVSVNNLSANKLDYYVDRGVEHEVVLDHGRAEVRTTVTLQDRSPEGLVPYVTGSATPGTSNLRIEFSFSPQATFTSLTLDGVSARGDVRFDPARARAFTTATLERSGRAVVELRYSLPLDGQQYVLRAVPQALARDADLRVTVRTADGSAVLGGPGLNNTSGRGIAERQGPWPQEEVLLAAAAPRPAGGWAAVRERLSRFWNEPVRAR